jgi:Putative peptidoglycan binding domain
VAPFPYVDYHPAYPYSVFLGPGAAQYNLPQMYWKAIGTTVDSVFLHTYTFNKIYKRQIFPLGQSYNRPRPSQLVRFRQNARAYGAAGVNWWVWQFTTPALWRSIGQPLPAAALRRRDGWPFLRRNFRGDMVVWAQQHLNGAGHPVAVDGYFGNGTRNAVLAFQAARGLQQNGVIDAATWQRLLSFQPAYIAWRSRPRPRVRSASAAAAGGRNGPVSATLPARAREIPPKPRGRG